MTDLNSLAEEGGVGAIPGSREPSPDGLGPSGFDPARDWEHVLEDGSIDHRWVTEFGITFCSICEQEKEFSE